MDIRFNVEVVTDGEERQENYLTMPQVMTFLLKMTPGDALVINAVEGPHPGEL